MISRDNSLADVALSALTVLLQCIELRSGGGRYLVLALSPSPGDDALVGLHSSGQRSVNVEALQGHTAVEAVHSVNHQ